MYRFLVLACLVALAVCDCGKGTGWTDFQSCAKPKMDEMKEKLTSYKDKFNSCLKEQGCVNPETAAASTTSHTDDGHDAKKMLECFKSSFTLLQKVETCVAEKVPDFAFPNFDQMGDWQQSGSSGSGGDKAAEIRAFLTMVNDPKNNCTMNKVTSCVKNLIGGSSGQNQMCTDIKSCIDKSFVGCDIQSTLHTVCDCANSILISENDAIHANSTNFFTCIGKTDAGQKEKDAMIAGIKSKVTEMCKLNYDDMCKQPPQGFQRGPAPPPPPPPPAHISAQQEQAFGSAWNRIQEHHINH